MINKSEITAFIISYYRGNRLRKCLETLKDLDNIIVWDNNTIGKELENIKQIEKDFPNVKFIYSEENIGWSKACNQGFILSETDWVMFCADDMLFDEDWFDLLKDILNEKPQLEQIHLNSFNAMVFHKKTVVRMGWWDEGYRYWPTMEDEDWYLRTVEILGYSYFGGIPPHFKNYFPDWYQKIAMKMNYQEWQFKAEDNFNFFCNSKHNKKYKIIGKQTITGEELDAGSRNNIESQVETSKGMTGVEYHFTKWRQIIELAELFDDDTYFSKDGRAYKRIKPEIDYYPEIRKQYAKKYFNIDINYEN